MSYTPHAAIPNETLVPCVAINMPHITLDDIDNLIIEFDDNKKAKTPILLFPKEVVNEKFSLPHVQNKPKTSLKARRRATNKLQARRIQVMNLVFP